MCGCGEKTRLADRTNAYYGYVAGHPMRFLAGHAGRLQGTPWGDSLWVEEDRGFSTPCWIWSGAKDNLGYGRSRKSGLSKSNLAHRESWAQSGRDLDPSLSLDHLCRNTSCVNPDHLEQVPHRVNMLRGKGTKLSQEIADEIRREYALGGWTYKTLAAKYGVEKRTVWVIMTGRRWTHDAPPYRRL
jgi:hypothetical protein